MEGNIALLYTHVVDMVDNAVVCQKKDPACPRWLRMLAGENPSLFLEKLVKIMT